MTPTGTAHPNYPRAIAGGLVFGALTALAGRFVNHHTWTGAVVGGVAGAVVWTAFMVGVDRYRRRRGRPSLFPNGRYRDNARAGWAAGRYRPRRWLALAVGYGAFAALGIVLLAAPGGSDVVGGSCLVLFGVLTAICVVQAVRSRRGPTATAR